MNETKEIGKFTKNSVEVVKVCRSKFGGKDVVDIRIWVTNNAGELVPTQKGICIQTFQVLDLINLLKKVEEEEEENK
jgi:hypothetical protein